MEGNGICSAAFCESAALRESFLLPFSGLNPLRRSRASSPEGGAFGHLPVSTNKAPPERTEFPRPGENVTAGDKRGNLASRSDD